MPGVCVSTNLTRGFQLLNTATKQLKATTQPRKAPTPTPFLRQKYKDRNALANFRSVDSMVGYIWNTWSKAGTTWHPEGQGNTETE